MISETVKELIRKARIVSFRDWQQTHPADAIALFQAADDLGRYSTDEELQQIEMLAPNSANFIPIAKLLRDHAPEIVDEAREKVLEKFPGITQPAGGLYPPQRAEACWRDFWHFLRCITYGMAGQQTRYTSPEGLHYMNLLYQELNVPLDAMIWGLESLKAASLQRVNAQDRPMLAPYFDHLITQLEQFSLR